MAVLRQQLVFVEHLQETGMLSEREAALMSVPIDMRVRKLSHQGPVWRAPLTHDVLRSIPILHEVLSSTALNRLSDAPTSAHEEPSQTSSYVRSYRFDVDLSHGLAGRPCP